MNYEKIYDDIISRAKNRIMIKGDYYENHHIKPKSLYPDLSKDKNNIVSLTAREHLVCHLLLIKIYKNIKMIRALSMMLSKNKHQDSRIITSKHYEYYRKLYNKNVKGKTLDELFSASGANNIRIAQKNKKFTQSDYQKQKNSERLKNKTYEELFGEVKAKELKEIRRKQRHNKTYEELFGADKAKEISNKISQSRLGKPTTLGRKHTPDELEKISISQKNSRATCIYCGLTTNPGNIARYHNDRCKLKT